MSKPQKLKEGGEKGKEKKKEKRRELYSYHERKNKKESFYTLLRISGSTDTNTDHEYDIWIQKK